jgi:hypothetical protein
MPGLFCFVGASFAGLRRHDCGPRLLALACKPAQPSNAQKVKIAKASHGRAVACHEQFDGFFDVGAHVPGFERFKTGRQQPEELVVGDNRSKKEFGGEFRDGTAQISGPGCLAEITDKLSLNTAWSLRVKDAANLVV